MERVVREVFGGYTNYAKHAWKGAVRRYPVGEAMIEPVVSMGFSDNRVEFTLRYIVDYKHRRRTRDRISTALPEELDRSGGRVGIASTTLQPVDFPAVEVRLTGESAPPGISTLE